MSLKLFPRPQKQGKRPDPAGLSVSQSRGSIALNKLAVQLMEDAGQVVILIDTDAHVFGIAPAADDDARAFKLSRNKQGTRATITGAKAFLDRFTDLPPGSYPIRSVPIPGAGTAWVASYEVAPTTAAKEIES